MNYYDKIAPSYNGLYKKEQIEKIKFIKKYCKGKILDIGCGPFYTSKFFKNIIGIDPSFNLLKLSSSKNIICAEAEHLPFKNKSFDTVISITSIQNFNNIKKAIQEIKRVCKNKIIITIIKKSKKIPYLKNSLKNSKILEQEKDLIFIV